ncbi:hypothetical protein Taro_051083 [Colocasia esculenta]|uniref:Uncharacterized protein n=1 Tax=Colocasia esculenta TaxID=4460 RepID=A0A843XF19_COLES|nr:hypothetical protein [Colocasia esculenta]
MVFLTWLLGVPRGDIWLFLPDLVEVRDVGACVVGLWSHAVAPVFRELLCLGGCVSRITSALCLTLLVLRESCLARLWLWVVAFSLFRFFVALCSRVVLLSLVGVPAALAGKGLLFEFIAYLTGLNSNPSGSSDPWVAVRPSGSLAGVREVRWLAFQQGPSLSCRRVLLLLVGVRAASVVVVSARAVVGFIFGLRIRVGVSRRLREPACGVAFTGAGLCSAEPVEGVLALLVVPFLLGCVLVACPLVVGVCVVFGLVRRWALCSAQSTSLLELSRCLYAVLHRWLSAATPGYGCCHPCADWL